MQGCYLMQAPIQTVPAEAPGTHNWLPISKRWREKLERLVHCLNTDESRVTRIKEALLTSMKLTFNSIANGSSWYWKSSWGWEKVMAMKLQLRECLKPTIKSWRMTMEVPVLRQPKLYKERPVLWNICWLCRRWELWISLSSTLWIHPGRIYQKQTWRSASWETCLWRPWQFKGTSLSRARKDPRIEVCSPWRSQTTKCLKLDCTLVSKEKNCLHI